MNPREDDFDKYIATQDTARERQQKLNESLAEEGPRIAAQYGSRFAESIAGIPAELAHSEPGNSPQGFQFLNEEGLGMLGQKGSNAVLGALGQKAPPTQNLGQQEVLPTQERLQEISEEATGGYTKSQGPLEEWGGDIVKKAAPMLINGGPRRALQTIGGVIIGDLGKRGLKKLGAPEGLQEAADLGLSTVVASIDPGAAQRATNRIYNRRDSYLPPGTTIPSRHLEQGLTNIENMALSGGPTVGSPEIITYINGLRGRIQNGRIPVSQLTDAKVKINQHRRRYAQNDNDRTLYNNIAGVVDDAIANYGHHNHAFYDAHIQADRMHQTIAEGAVWQDALRSAIKSPLKSAVGALIGGKAALAAPIPVAAGAATAYTAAKGYEVLYRVLNNPDLRQLYTQTLAQTARGNMVNAVKDLNRLDQKYASMYPDNTKEDDELEQFRVKK